MQKNNVARDYLIGTVLVLIILAISVVFIRFTTGLVEPEVEQGMGGVIEGQAVARVQVLA